MSPVTPKPEAEFSTLAITKSIARCSTSAGIARRATSRPGLPKMSPTNRIFMRRSARPHFDADVAAAPLGNPGKHDAEFAGGEGGARGASVERSGQADGAREAAEAALGEVERCLAVLARRRQLLAGDDQCPTRDHHLKALGRHSRKIHDDLDGRRCFYDVERRAALSSGAAALLLVERVEQAPRLIAELTPIHEYASH